MDPDFNLALAETGLSKEPFDERLDIRSDTIFVTRKNSREECPSCTTAKKLSLLWSVPLCTSYMYLSRCNRENAPKIMSRLLGCSRQVFCYEFHSKDGYGEKEGGYAHDYLKFITHHRFRLLWWSVRTDDRVAFLYSL